MKTESLANPQVVSFDITDRCNFRCQTCDKWKTPPEEKELSSEEIKKILFELKGWLGSYLVFISGGEPLLRKDLIDLFKFCHQQGIGKGFITNGSLINHRTARELSSAGLKLVNISINSTDPEKQDKIRGINGCLEKIEKAIKILKARKFQVVLNCVIDSNNINKLNDLVNWAKERDCRILFQAYFSGSFAFHKNEEKSYILEKDWYLKDSLMPKNKEEISQAIDRLIELKRKGFNIANSEKQLNFFKEYFLNPSKSLPFPCQDGQKSFNLDPYGNMRLCFNFPPLGNLKKDSVKELWLSEKAEKQREAIKKCQYNCKVLNCNF